MTQMVDVIVARYRVSRYFSEDHTHAAQTAAISNFLEQLPYWDYVMENFRLEIKECLDVALDAVNYHIVARMTEQERTMFLLKYGTPPTQDIEPKR